MTQYCNPRIPLIQALESRRLFAAGDIDTTFGTNGFVIDPVSARRYRATDIEVLPGDKMLVASQIPDADAQGFSHYLLRKYNADGTLDSTFGTNGSVDGRLNGDSELSLIELAPNNKIIGLIYMPTGSSHGEPFALARFNADGSLDATFGNTGSVMLPRDPSISPGDYSVAVADDGKVLVAVRHTVTRFTDAGVLDTTFGTGGIVNSPLSGGLIHAVRPLSDGSVLVGGDNFPEPSGAGDQSFVLEKLKNNGTPDTNFGTGGIVTTNMNTSTTPTGFEIIYDIRVQTDGKILAVGPANGAAAARYSATGQLDNSFGVGGKRVLAGGYGAKKAIIDSNGNIYLLDDYASVARLTSSGNLDATFGRVYGAGNTYNDFFDGAGVLLSNGKLILAGGRADIGGSHIELLARRTVDDGSPSPISLANGTVSVTGTTGDDRIDMGDFDAVSVTMNELGRSYNRTDVNLISVNGGDGNDTLNGNAGDDIFTSNDNAFDALFGDGGHDSATADVSDMTTSIETLI